MHHAEPSLVRPYVRVREDGETPMSRMEAAAAMAAENRARLSGMQPRHRKPHLSVAA